MPTIPQFNVLNTLILSNSPVAHETAVFILQIDDLLSSTPQFANQVLLIFP